MPGKLSTTSSSLNSLFSFFAFLLNLFKVYICLIDNVWSLLKVWILLSSDWVSLFQFICNARLISIQLCWVDILEWSVSKPSIPTLACFHSCLKIINILESSLRPHLEYPNFLILLNFADSSFLHWLVFLVFSKDISAFSLWLMALLGCGLLIVQLFYCRSTFWIDRFTWIIVGLSSLKVFAKMVRIFTITMIQCENWVDFKIISSK